MKVSLNDGTPQSTPKWSFLGRKTHGPWVPPYEAQAKDRQKFSISTGDFTGLLRICREFPLLGLPGGQSLLLHGATVELSPGQWIPNQLNDMHTHKYVQVAALDTQNESISNQAHFCSTCVVEQQSGTVIGTYRKNLMGVRTALSFFEGGLWNFPKTPWGCHFQKTWVLGIVVFVSMKLYRWRTHASTFPI